MNRARQTLESCNWGLSGLNGDRGSSVLLAVANKIGEGDVNLLRELTICFWKRKANFHEGKQAHYRQQEGRQET